MADSAASQQLFDLWKKQFDEGTRAWSRLMTQLSPPSTDPLALWRPFLDQAFQTWAQFLAQTPLTPETLAQGKQLLDQWIEAWSTALGQLMATPAFAQMMGRSLDQWLAMQAPIKRATDDSLQNLLQALNLPTRTQVSGVAKQIIELEERIERLEDSVTRLLKQMKEVSPHTSQAEVPTDRERR